MRFLLLLILLSPLGCGQDKGKPVPGKISFILGTVQVNGKEAKLFSPVGVGDKITTAEHSSCRILIGNDTIIQIGESAELLYDIHTLSGTLKLTKGFLGAVITNKKEITPWRVATPTVVASVRGTVFFIKVDSPDSTYTCLCNGNYDLQGVGEKRPVAVESAHHKALEFVKKGKIAVPRISTLKFHDDEFMESLAKEIGYTINWKEIPR